MLCDIYTQVQRRSPSSGVLYIHLNTYTYPSIMLFITCSALKIIAVRCKCSTIDLTEPWE